MKQRNLKAYQQLNSLCAGHCAVLFGSGFAAGIRVGELAQDCNLSRPVYNRSLEQLSVFEASELLQTCVFDLAPEVLFLNLGEDDLEPGAHTMDEVIARYAHLLAQIHAAQPKCRIHVVSVCGAHADAHLFNRALREMANRAGCRFVDISGADATEQPELHAFGVLRGFMRPKRLSFCDAMSLAPQIL